LDSAIESLLDRRKTPRESVLRYLYRCATAEYLTQRNWSIHLLAKQLGVKEWDVRFWLTHASSELTDTKVIPRLEAFFAKEERIARGERLTSTPG